MNSPTTFSIPPRALAGFGTSIERLCERAGVAPSNAWSTGDFFRLWTVAEQVLNDPSAGLRFGSGGIAGGYGVASIVALHAADFRQALATLCRYKLLTCPELVEVEINGDEAVVRYRWLHATAGVPRLLVDTTLASLKALAHQGTGGLITPRRVELTRRSTHPAMLREHFDCPIVFGAPYDAMVFDRAALDVPFVTADGGAFAHVLQGLENRVATGEGFSALVGEVRVAIARQLSEGRAANIAAVAQRLNLSGRTLQRRLGACNASFQQQLEGVRRATASRLLIDTELDTVAIAMLLGFVEPNSFTRAFRAWEHTTPLRWRARYIRHLA